MSLALSEIAEARLIGRFPVHGQPVAPQEIQDMDRTRTVPIAPESPIAELRNASSGERLLGLYSHAVAACGDRDPEQVVAALEELISLLDFGYGEVAEGFYRLYSFCLREIRLGQFDQPAWILRDLRDTWAHTLRDATADAASSEVEPAAQLG
jgi:hypothetical protein